MHPQDAVAIFPERGDRKPSALRRQMGCIFLSELLSYSVVPFGEAGEDVTANFK